MTPPVPQDDKSIPFSIKKYLEARLTEEWQQGRLNGFTTNEIIAAGASAGAVKDDDLRDFKGQLDNEMHPLYARDMWIRRDGSSNRKLPANLACYMIGHGKEGWWEVSKYSFLLRSAGADCCRRGMTRSGR